MHVPDGFLNAPTSVATGAVAAAGVAVALRKSRDELQDKAAPLAGLTAAYVFAAQMINFPVGAGTSGHLMGGALAAVLVGPWTAALCMSVVLLIQALLFADGGLTALGTNITLIGFVTVAAGWLVVRALLAVFPKRPRSVIPAAVAGAFVSVPVAAVAFSMLFAIGGQTNVPFATLVTTMVGWHTLIGIGEAAITGFTVAAVLAVRPDLVYAARGLAPRLQLKRADGSVVPESEPAASGGRRSRPVLIGGLAATAAVAGVVSAFASGHPDGLEFVAEDEGFLGTATDHVFGGFALADYGEVGGIPVGIAGLLGAVATIAVAVVVFRIAGRRSHEAHDA